MAFLNRIEAGEAATPASEVAARASEVEVVVVAPHETVVAEASQRGPIGESASRSLRLELDLGRTAAVVVVAIVLVAAAVFLYADGDPASGRIFLDILIGVVSGGLGINVGERSGAKEAEDKLYGGR